jgi:hypothetical protein
MTDYSTDEFTDDDLSMMRRRGMIFPMRASTSAVPDCPLAPPSRETTYVRTLHRACLILGGLSQLAYHLKVSEYSLDVWLQGREEPPESVFYAAVEIVLLHIDNAGQAN